MFVIGKAFDRLKENKLKNHAIAKFLLDVVEIVMDTAVLLIIFYLLFDIRTVPTGSMIPTININERVFFEKPSVYFKQVNRGDVVMFDATEVNTDKESVSDNIFFFKWMPWIKQNEVDYLKRVIAVGGDKILMKNGVLYLNGKKFTPNYKTTPGDDYNSLGEVTVPKGYVFVMGDNRPTSYDSRKWADYVPAIQENKVKGFKSIKGITFVSLDRIKAKGVFKFNLGKFLFKGL